jgi:hypothetical protein
MFQFAGKTKDKIILGIDPGTNITGYGLSVLQEPKPELIAVGVIVYRNITTITLNEAYFRKDHCYY